MDKDLLTILIIGRNEGEEVENTLRSIRNTVSENIRILFIDDNSDDGYDYDSICKQYSAEHVFCENRLGVSEARNYGVSLCDGNFVILDAHMRFYAEKWDRMTVEMLNRHPKSIICSKTAVIKKDQNGNLIGEDGSTRFETYGGRIEYLHDGDAFAPKWSYSYIEEVEDNLVSVPCVLGAFYASNTEWWNHIGGINGLIKWGSDEIIMSAKSWLAGGECLCIKNLYVGHLYRKINPNGITSSDAERNELYAANFFLRDKNKISEYEESLKKRIGGPKFEIVKKLFEETKGNVENDRENFYENVAVKEYEYFEELNRKTFQKEENPKISVLIPVYNGEKYIKESINSVLEQTFQDFEIVIVNDGSTDSTRKIVESYNDKRIRLFNRNHFGIANSLNFGITHCRGELIARLDADDVMFDDRLEFQNGFMDYNKDYDIAGFGFQWGNGKEEPEFLKPANVEVTIDRMLRGNIIAHPTVIMRKSSLMKLPFWYEGYYSCEDYKLWMTALSHGLRLCTCAKPVIIYRQHKEQLTQKNYYKLQRDTNRICRIYTYKNDGNLTCVITGRNEGAEVERTITSIRATADNVRIVFIDDNSDDNFNYESICNYYGVKYVKNDEQIGCVGSRNKIKDVVDTDYFCLFDAHMRLYDDHWDTRLLEILEKNPNCIVTSESVSLTVDGEGNYINENGEDRKGTMVNGAYINLYEKGWEFTEKWTNKYIEDIDDNIASIGCVLGAVYASSVKHWENIHAIEGLDTYGGDEPFMSLKTWLSGGKCLIVKNWGVGHLYRNIQPFKMKAGTKHSNQLFIEHFFCNDKKQLMELENNLKNRIGENNFNKAKSKLDTKKLEAEKKYFYENVAKITFSDFEKINSKAKI